jgi:hypothetical protein
MTTTVNALTTAVVSGAGNYTSLTNSYGLILVLLLLSLLIYKEIARASGDQRANQWAGTFNIAIVPLLIGFALVVALRFYDQLT